VLTGQQTDWLPAGSWRWRGWAGAGYHSAGWTGRLGSQAGSPAAAATQTRQRRDTQT